MGIFGFVKKIFVEEQKEKVKDSKEEPVIEISLDELALRLEAEKKKIIDQGNVIKTMITEEVKILVQDLSQKEEKLRKINLTEKKENEKLKLVVEENLGFYLNQLERLINDFKKIDVDLDIKFFITRIQTLVENFEKNSLNHYEKATILIGKDLAEIKESIREFLKKVNFLLNENIANFDKEKKIDIIEKSMREVESFSGTLKYLMETIEGIDTKSDELTGEKETLEMNFRSFRRSDDFEKYIKEREELKREISEFNREIMKFKDKVNIRFLLKYFHRDAKKSALLKNYQDNFVKALDEDEIFEIVKLVNEVLYTDISEEAMRFVNWNRDIKEKNKEHQVERKIKIFENGIRNIDIQIDSNKKQLESEKLKLKKFKKRKKEILDTVNLSVKSVFSNVIVA